MAVDRMDVERAEGYDGRWDEGPDPLAGWDVRDGHVGMHIHGKLSQLAMRRAGFEESPVDREVLDSWLGRLASLGCVVEYLPSRPEGFVLVWAREGIDTDVVRSREG